MRKPPRRRKDRFSGRARVSSSGARGHGWEPREARSRPPRSRAPSVEGVGSRGWVGVGGGGEGRPDSSSSAALRRGRARAPTSTRLGLGVGGEGLPGGGCAPRSARPPSRAAPGRASAARRRARPPPSFTISRPRAPPSSPGIQTAFRRRLAAQDFRPSSSAALRPSSVPGGEEGQGGGRTEQPGSSSSLATGREHSCHQPAAQPAASAAGGGHFSALFGLLGQSVCWGGGGFGKTHLRS